MNLYTFLLVSASALGALFGYELFPHGSGVVKAISSGLCAGAGPLVAYLAVYTNRPDLEDE